MRWNQLLYRICSVVLLLFLGSRYSSSAQDSVRSISFRDAVAMAVESSDDLKTEFAMQAIREGAWQLGLRAFLPKLTVSAAEDDRLSKMSADSFQKTYTVSVEQFLWDGGRTSTSRAIEKAELAIMSTDLARKMVSVADAALSSYRSVLSARALIEIREAVFESLREQQRILAEEVSRGLALEADLVEADISVSEAAIEILSLQIELEEAEQQLAEVLGVAALPLLAEKVDVHRTLVLPQKGSVQAAARARNSELVSARHAIAKKQVEARYAALSWIPTVSLSGGVSFSGRRYPLTRAAWSVGLSVDFSSPWFTSRMSGSLGWEPPYEQTAGLQGSVSPVPDPASGLRAKNTELALALERVKYDTAFERVGRNAEMALERCYLTERKRGLAVESLQLSADRLRLTELRLGLGQITRIDLMEAQIAYAQKEVAAVEIAVSLLEAERALETLLEIPPGGLAEFAGQQLRLRN
jgi:outer membrane protein TolC